MRRPEFPSTSTKNGQPCTSDSPQASVDITTGSPGGAWALTSPGISISGPLVTTTNRVWGGSPSSSGRWKAFQNPAHDAQPDDRNASRVSWSEPEGATAKASPDGVTPAMVGADAELRSPGSGGPMVSGTLTGPRLPDARAELWSCVSDPAGSPTPAPRSCSAFKMSAWLRNRPATRTDNSSTTMLRTIAKAITHHLRKRNELATPALKRQSPYGHRTDCGARSGVSPRWRNVRMRMRSRSGEPTDGTPGSRPEVHHGHHGDAIVAARHRS